MHAVVPSLCYRGLVIPSSITITMRMKPMEHSIDLSQSQPTWLHLIRWVSCVRAHHVESGSCDLLPQYFRSWKWCHIRRRRRPGFFPFRRNPSDKDDLKRRKMSLSLSLPSPCFEISYKPFQKRNDGNDRNGPPAIWWKNEERGAENEGEREAQNDDNIKNGSSLSFFLSRAMQPPLTSNSRCHP